MVKKKCGIGISQEKGLHWMDVVGINKEFFFFLRTRIKRIVMMMLSIIISWDISQKEFYWSNCALKSELYLHLKLTLM